MGKIVKNKIEYSGGGGGSEYTAGAGIKIENGTISGTKVDASKGATSIIEVEGVNASKLGFEFGEDVVLSASSPMLFGESVALQKKLVSGTNIKTIDGESLLGAGNIATEDAFVATYGVTSYADLTEAIAADKVIVLTMTANQNLFCMTYSTYHNGGNAVMYAIFSYNGHPTLMTVTLTPSDNWTISHERLQEELVSGTNIKTINNTSLLGSGNIDIQTGVDMEIGAEKWYGTYTEDDVTYQVYSKVIKIAALPSAAGIVNYPHGITGIKQILCAYGFGTNGFVLNAPRQNAQDNIAIYQVQKASGGSVAIEVGKDRSNMGAYVCLVYAKNN